MKNNVFGSLGVFFSTGYEHFRVVCVWMYSFLYHKFIFAKKKIVQKLK